VSEHFNPCCSGSKGGREVGDRIGSELQSTSPEIAQEGVGRAGHRLEARPAPGSGGPPRKPPRSAQRQKTTPQVVRTVVGPARRDVEAGVPRWGTPRRHALHEVCRKTFGRVGAVGELARGKPGSDVGAGASARARGREGLSQLQAHFADLLEEGGGGRASPRNPPTGHRVIWAAFPPPQVGVWDARFSSGEKSGRGDEGTRRLGIPPEGPPVNDRDGAPRGRSRGDTRRAHTPPQQSGSAPARGPRNVITRSGVGPVVRDCGGERAAHLIAGASGPSPRARFPGLAVGAAGYDGPSGRDRSLPAELVRPGDSSEGTEQGARSAFQVRTTCGRWPLKPSARGEPRPWG